MRFCIRHIASRSCILAGKGMEVIKVEGPEPRGGMGRDVLTPVLPTPETEIHHARSS